jgi:hypothetical protein
MRKDRDDDGLGAGLLARHTIGGGDQRRLFSVPSRVMATDLVAFSPTMSLDHGAFGRCDCDLAVD